MRLSQKLLLFVLAAAVIPLAFAGFWLLREAERELSARLEREQRALAAASAEAAGTQLAATLDSLAQSASLIDWSKVSAAEAEGGLQLLSSQSPVVVSAALQAPSTRAFVGPRDDRPQLKVERDELLALLPLATLAAYGDDGQMALGAAQDSPVGPWMPAAIQVGPRGAKTPMVVVALTLSVLDRWLVEHAPQMTTLEIVDADGRVIASSQWHQKVARLDEGRLAAVRAGLPLVNSATEQLATEKVPGKLGLTAVASIPLEVARAPIRSLRRSVLGGMGGTLVLLVIVSLVFARRLSFRLGSLSSVATAYGKGELSHRVHVAGADELTELARTFNAMGSELERSRARLLTWNDELKQRVDEATAELRAAQAQLLEAQKLAAIGQLGAGVAHEINNPLVGILGNAQLLLMDTPETDDNFALLKQIEQSAQRCREITQQLLRFSQKRGQVSLAPMDLNALVTRAMSLEKDRSPGIAVEVLLPREPTRIDGDAEQIEQVIAQLCANARTAMKVSLDKRLIVEVKETTLTVRDSGKGIAPEHLERIFEPFFTTKDVWTNIGLGLAVAYRVMQEHQGRIEVESAPGQGAKFTLHFKPAGTTQRKTASSPSGIGGQGKGITG
ncbi:MAG: two-component sensor histidine kinase [Archangium gephyra]|uniref:histidine kinase n=1 Tax=Archangium gephyra TaxID=48 RepID=A0A2W5TPV7_9BACT|nr:MAG: two-component sensor histidine kinase [Archangium gephyra]